MTINPNVFDFLMKIFSNMYCCPVVTICLIVLWENQSLRQTSSNVTFVIAMYFNSALH